MDIEKITDIDQLSGEQRELAETVGLDAYKKLVVNYGGMCVYIHKSETVCREIRNAEIFRNFNGYNYRELAQKYGLSEKTVREIISEKKSKIIDGQASFF